MAIKLEQVKKTYKVGEVETHALRGVDLIIEDGEMVVILGPSGSGKSTLLNLVGGLDSVTEGNIYVSGEDITNYKDKQLVEFRRKKIGFIFQQYNLLPNLTVRENVEVGAYLTDSEIDIDNMLKQVDMYEHKDKYPHQLSGGQQQRVSIARALAKDPSILFCDEPTGALDEETGKQVLTVLQKLNQEIGTTIIIITHNVAIKDMADKVVRLTSGNISDVEINENKKDVSEVSWA